MNTRNFPDNPRPRTTPPGTRRTSPLPADWAARRAAVFERDGNRCTWLEDGQRCTQEASDCDHIGDPDDHSLDALRALCGYHHRKRTALQARLARGPMPSRERPRAAHPGLLTDEQAKAKRNEQDVPSF
ncbi:HNH endonuclease [Streptomyces sp. UG1]|uniref:HNH endonuclease n=1 Tax=Streptomyces sp. UG1 TaxID=3417652 RepID=UPI003CF499E6